MSKQLQHRNYVYLAAIACLVGISVWVTVNDVFEPDYPWLMDQPVVISNTITSVPDTSDKRLLVKIYDDETYDVNDAPIPADELETYLRSLTNDFQAVLIGSDALASHDRYHFIEQTALDAGYTNITYYSELDN